MTTRWKIAVVAALLLACAALGLAVAVWVATDVEIAQSGDDLRVNLSQVFLQYEDPLQGIGLEQVTVRRVIQDALWYQLMNPQSPEGQRAEIFFMIGLFNEGRSAEITPEQYAILQEAIRQVWGPAVIAEIEAMVGGAP